MNNVEKELLTINHADFIRVLTEKLDKASLKLSKLSSINTKLIYNIEQIESNGSYRSIYKVSINLSGDEINSDIYHFSADDMRAMIPIIHRLYAAEKKIYDEIVAELAKL